MADAASAEDDPEAAEPVVTPVACALPDRPPDVPALAGEHAITLRPGTLARRLYGRAAVEETYFCSYELNPAYRARLEAAGLVFSGEAADGAARIAELADHPFFLATAFLPQLASTPVTPHPLIRGFFGAVQAARERRGENRCRLHQPNARA